MIACLQPQDTSGEVWFSDPQSCNDGASKIQQSKDKIGLGSAQIIGASYIQTPGGDDIFAGDISKPAATPGGTPGNTPGADVIPSGKSATPGNTPKPAPQATPGQGTRYTDGTGMTPGQNNPTPQPLPGAATSQIKSTPQASANMKMPKVGQMHEFSKLPALGSQPKPAVIQQEIVQEP